MEGVPLALLHLPGPAEHGLSTFLASIPPQTKARILRLLVFGSASRGTMGADSDVDLYIVWEGPEAEAFELMMPAVADVLVDAGVRISLHPVSAERHARMARHPTLFFSEVMRDGIAIPA